MHGELASQNIIKHIMWKAAPNYIGSSLIDMRHSDSIAY